MSSDRCDDLGAKPRNRKRRLSGLRGLALDQKGQAAVETMLAVPVLMLLLLAMAQLFLISDAAIDTLVQAHVEATKRIHAKDWSKEFGIWEVTRTGTIEALPGMADLIDAYFKSRSGATAAQYSVERKLWVAGGSFAGTSLSGFGDWGDEDGYSKSSVRPAQVEKYFK
jgi:hypothetical protein